MSDKLDSTSLQQAVAAIQAGRRDPQAVARAYQGQPDAGKMLETCTTRDRVEHFRWGHQCVPVPPDDGDPAWFIVDSSDDWRTRWGRWRDVGRA
jgi:hypothetical protein